MEDAKDPSDAARAEGADMDGLAQRLAALRELAPRKAPAAEPSPPERPAHYYAVVDAQGLVGVFYSMAGADAFVLRAFPLIPFLVHRFPVAPGPCATVWVVLYRGNDAVAFLSNDRAEAERVQAAYANVGLVYPDPLDYWERPVGELTPGARERLGSMARAHEMYAGPALDEDLRAREAEDLKRVDRLLDPDPENNPLARLLRETERISIVDAIVSTGSRADFAPGADVAGAGPADERPADERPADERPADESPAGDG